MRIRQLLTALGLNAVPAFGWFIGEWSAGTTLVLYWLETLLAILLVAIRIILHRRSQASKGHWDYRAPQGQQKPIGGRSTYLASFLVPALIFTFAHGVFLAALGGMIVVKGLSSEAHIETDHLLVGLIGISIFQIIDLAFDLVWLKSRPFAWIERLGNQCLSRVFVIHLTIIGGMCAVMFTGANRHFFGVFIFLKTMLNISLVTPQWQPETPPAWLSNLMDRVPSSQHKGKSFAQFWKQTDDDEHARLARNEKPMEKATR